MMKHLNSTRVQGTIALKCLNWRREVSVQKILILLKI